MKKIVILVLLLCSLSLLALKLPEEPVAYDSELNPIYQVDAGEIQIGFQVLGEGEPLLLLMGLGGTMMNWPKTVIDMLSYPNFRVKPLQTRKTGDFNFF